MEKEKSTVISKQVQNYVVNLNNTEINLKILYEDNHIIVVEKPVNIPSQGDKTGDIDMLTIVKQYIKEKYNKPGNVYLGLVHRLDRPVGGVMVFAKTSKAAARLSEQVREKVFKNFQINDEVMSVAKNDAMVLHCLPAHREEEITAKVFEEHANEIFDEAENRLHAQKAVLVKLLG